MKFNKAIFVLASAAALSGLACLPPKILISSEQLGKDHSVKYFLMPAAQQSGQIAGAMVGDKQQQLYDFWVRICNYDPANTEAVCHDTRVVENVVPQTVY